jgi:hypothetical protein
MDRTELTRIGAALRRQYEVTKQAPLTPSMLALLVQLRETEHLSRQAPGYNQAKYKERLASRAGTRASLRSRSSRETRWARPVST